MFKRILIHLRPPKYTGNVFFQKWHNLGPIWKVSCIFFHRSRGVYLLTLYFFSLAIIVTYHFSSRIMADFQCSKIPGTKGQGACQQIWNSASWYCSCALEKAHWHETCDRPSHVMSFHIPQSTNSHQTKFHWHKDKPCPVEINKHI
jgi:hypothetical protein